jgi:hypothetical protein
MSIYIGLDKESEEHDRSQIQYIIETLIDNGYIRELVEIDPECKFLKFDRGVVEVLPAYEVDKKVLNNKNT